MFSHLLLNFIITILISIGIIMSIHSLWNYLKDTYTTKKTKDLVNRQIEKYKKMLEIQKQQTEFISEQEQETMKNDLLQYVETL